MAVKTLDERFFVTIISNIEDVLDVLTEKQRNKLSLLKEFRVKGLYRYCISTGRYSEEIITYEDFKTIFFVPYGDKYLFRYSNTFCITEILDRFHTLYCQANAIKD